LGSKLEPPANLERANAALRSLVQQPACQPFFCSALSSPRPRCSLRSAHARGLPRSGSRPVAGFHVQGPAKHSGSGGSLSTEKSFQRPFQAAASPLRWDASALDCPALGPPKTLEYGRRRLADGENGDRERCLEPEVVDLRRSSGGDGGESGALAPAPDDHHRLASRPCHGADYAVIPESHRSGHAVLLAAAITRSELTLGPIATEPSQRCDHQAAKMPACSLHGSARRPHHPIPGDLRPV